MAGRKKKTSRKKAGKTVAKRRTTEVTNWREELAKEAKDEGELTPLGTGNTISLGRNMQFKFQGSDLGDELEVVIVGHVFANKYFDTPYDTDNPMPPACFALGVRSDTMFPDSSSPDKQHEVCDGCWANDWGSAEGSSRGKACAEKIRLAVVYADDSLSRESDVMYVEVPPTSTAAFNTYVSKLTKTLEVPSWAVVTQLKFDEHKDQQALVFTMITKVPDKLLPECKTLNKAAKSSLLEPPDVSGYKKPAGGKKAKAKKKTGKKKIARSRRTGKKKATKKATKKRSRFSK